MTVYIGLVLTSLGFFVPGWVAWRRHRRRRRDPRPTLDLATSLVLGTTSVLYHGTLNPIAQTIDILVAHSIAFFSMGRTLYFVVRWRRGWVELGIAGGTFGSILIYLLKSRTNPYEDSKLFHMLFHLTSQATWVGHLLTSP